MSDDKKRYYRKYPELYPLLEKMKLWPSRRGLLHGVRSIRLRGNIMEITTHCGKCFRAYDSRKSRAARWLRNKWAVSPCAECAVPQWKLLKYTNTFFSAHYGKSFQKPQTAQGEPQTAEGEPQTAEGEQQT